MKYTDKFHRGQVWFRNTEIPVMGSVQRTKRPVLIIGNNVESHHLSTLQVAPITKQKKDPFQSYVVFYFNNIRATVLVNQITTISKFELSDYMYDVGDDIMDKVEAAIMYTFEIDTSAKILASIDRMIDRLMESKRIEYGLPNAKSADDIALSITNKVSSLISEFSNLPKNETDKSDNSDDKKMDQNQPVKLDQPVKPKRTPVVYTISEEDLLKAKQTSENKLNQDRKSQIEKFNERFIKANITKIKSDEKVPAKPVNKNDSVKTVDKKDSVGTADSTETFIKNERGYWTVERKKEFIADKESISLDEVREKWKLRNTNTVSSMYCHFKKSLGNLNKAQ